MKLKSFKFHFKSRWVMVDLSRFQSRVGCLELSITRLKKYYEIISKWLRQRSIDLVVSNVFEMEPGRPSV